MTGSIGVSDFGTWRAGYALASVRILVAGTTTLAAVFSDPQLTVPAANPQTLGILEGPDGTLYGKWAAPIYVGTPYVLTINDEGATGIRRLPLYDMAGVDASSALVQSARPGSIPRALRDVAIDQIRLLSFGTVSASPTNNNALLTVAIGAAGAVGGGDVLLPEGVIDFTTLTLPANVRLVGAGRGVTTLRSQEASTVITFGGIGSGLRNLTLDGSHLVGGSTGILSIGRNAIVLDDVDVKRFETGVVVRGGTGARFRDVYLTNCTRGGRLRGDLNTAAGGGGAALLDFSWSGGSVAAHSEFGVEIACEDASALGAEFEKVLFDSNTGDAVRWTGARSGSFRSCRWTSNVCNMRVADGTNAAAAAINTTIGLLVEAGHFSGGELRWDGTCKSVVYDTCIFEGVSFIASVPINPISFRDCQQDAATAQTGATERLMRDAGNRRGSFAVQTTDATATAVWRMELNPGEVVRIRGEAVARQANGVNTASYALEGVYTRAGATIDFDSASGTLAAGTTVQGTTSGFTARVQASSQTGAAGTITLRDIVGVPQSGEGLVFSNGMDANATGSLVTANAATIANGTATGFTHETDTDWAFSMGASGSQARLLVVGKASQTIDWNVTVHAVLGGVA